MTRCKALQITIVMTVALGLTASGCQTYAGSAAAGAAAGAGTGAVIGHQSGKQGEGALIGAVLGGLAGLIVHDVRVRQTRSATETAEAYEYEPQQGEVLELEDALVYPSPVTAGNMAEATVQYALLGANGQRVNVEERRILKKGAETIADLGSKTYRRGEGTWVSTLPFRVPEDIAPGDYTMVQIVATGNTQITSTTDFRVTS